MLFCPFNARTLSPRDYVITNTKQDTAGTASELTYTYCKQQQTERVRAKMKNNVGIGLAPSPSERAFQETWCQNLEQNERIFCLFTQRLSWSF